MRVRVCFKPKRIFGNRAFRRTLGNKRGITIKEKANSIGNLTATYFSLATTFYYLPTRLRVFREINRKHTNVRIAPYKSHG